MKVLVTGAGGFLGTSLVERLLAHGEDDLRLFVRATSKRSQLEALARKYPQAKIEIFVGNLNVPQDNSRALEGVGVVYHLAATGYGAAAELFLTTVVSSKYLLDAIVALPRPQRPRVVFISSFGVYGTALMRRGALVDESSPLEAHPQKRDVYSQTKLRQERLFWEYRQQHGFELVVLRPGVIYGPGGSAISTRVGLNLFGMFLYMGGRNVLPLTYVDNCAEAIVVAGQAKQVDGEIYNLVDDDVPTCRQYLRRYQRSVKKLRTVFLPYPATLAMSYAVEWYNKWSRGQLPAVFTPYKSATTWGGNRFDNSKIKSLGYRQIVPTSVALDQTFAALRAEG